MMNELQIFCSLPKCEKDADTECIDCEYMVREEPKKRMTNEEAIEVLENDIEICTTQQKEAVDMAIKALEQQPCEDCISRKAVKEMLIAEWTKYMPMEMDVSLSFVLEKISKLPSVTPKQRIGKEK